MTTGLLVMMEEKVVYRRRHFRKEGIQGVGGIDSPSKDDHDGNANNNGSIANVWDTIHAEEYCGLGYGFHHYMPWRNMDHSNFGILGTLQFWLLKRMYSVKVDLGYVDENGDVKPGIFSQKNYGRVRTVLSSWEHYFHLLDQEALRL